MHPRRHLSTALAILAGAAHLAGAQDAPPPAEITQEQAAIAATAPVAAALGPVRVLPVDDFALIPDDFWTHGGFGDIVLRNDYAGFTFGAATTAGDQPNYARQGSILDIFPAPSAPESFEVFQPSTDFASAGRTVFQSAMEFAADPSGDSATVTVRGHDLGKPQIAIESTYEMRRDWPGLLATTTFKNTGEADVELAMLGDHVGLGAMVPFLSGSGYSMKAGIVDECEFFFARRQDSFVFIKPLEGFFTYRNAQQSGAIAYKQNVTIKPGGSETIKRWILTNSTDPSQLFAFTLKQKGPAAYGGIGGRIVERTQLADGRVTDTALVPNAEVRLSIVDRPDMPKSYMLRPYIHAVTDAQGNFSTLLPPGEYRVSAASPSRLSDTSPIALRVEAGKVAARDVAVSRPSTVTYETFDAETGEPIPAKISFQPLRGTNEPDFGPPGGLASGAAMYTFTGKGLAEVPAGDYRVVASHGNEYHTAEARVRLQASRSESVRFDLKRAFKTDGWISADVVQTNRSPHSRTDPRDRVVSAIAEGLDWVITGDLNRITNLQPVVDALAAGDRIKASPGLRIGSTVESPRSEFLLFPTGLCKDGPAIDLEAILAAKTPAETIRKIREVCSDAVLVANRPIFPAIGILAMQDYDLATGRFPLARTMDVKGIDAFQIWEGKRQAIVEQSIDAWYGLIGRESPRLAIFGNSHSAGTYNEEPGYPRMYIKSSQDSPRKLDEAELAKSIREGRVMVTNGPFIELLVDGKAGIGDTVVPKDKQLTVSVRVYSPNWANVSSVSVNLNGAFARKFVIPAASADPEAGLVFPRNDEAAEFKLNVAADSILTILVEGDPGLQQDPVNPLVMPSTQRDLPRGQITYAVTGPIYIDADGDGKVTPDLESFRGKEAQSGSTVAPF